MEKNNNTVTYNDSYIRRYKCNMERSIKSVYINLGLKITRNRCYLLIHLYETCQNYEKDFLLCLLNLKKNAFLQFVSSGCIH